MAQNLPVVQQSAVMVNAPSAPRQIMKLSDFPSFNGKMVNWATFHMEFTSVARIYKMGKLLTTDTLHQNKFATDQDYKDKCETLFHLLNKSCAHGDAHSKVKKHEVTMDRYLAWQDLVNFYFTKGNVDAYVTTNIAKIVKLQLEFNTAGGMEHYIVKFKEYVTNLEEVGQPISNLLKHMFFLNGIKDPYYKPVMTVCKAQQYTLEKCVSELQCVRLQSIASQ